VIPEGYYEEFPNPEDFSPEDYLTNLRAYAIIH